MKLFTSKKAIGGGVGGGPRQPISLLMGVIFLVFGLLPLLNMLGVVGFTIPIVPVGMILWILATIGGFLLLWDAISEKMGVAGGLEGMMRMGSLVSAFVLLALGLIPILNSLGVIGFTLPSILGGIIKDVLFTIVGFLLLYGGTKQF